ncbi:MAG: hypothetical protein AAGH19_08625 [Pseudomonadota bacterium]
MQSTVTTPGNESSQLTVAHAVIFDEPRKLSVRPVTLPKPAAHEVLVDILWSGISTGTERLLWTGL